MDEELLQRQVPQALEAEQSVLGSMLIDERCVPDVVGMLQPDDFYLRQNREIYETIYTMFNFSEKIDPVTVLNKMKERGKRLEYLKFMAEELKSLDMQPGDEERFEKELAEYEKKEKIMV